MFKKIFIGLMFIGLLGSTSFAKNIELNGDPDACQNLTDMQRQIEKVGYKEIVSYHEASNEQWIDVYYYNPSLNSYVLARTDGDMMCLMAGGSDKAYAQHDIIEHFLDVLHHNN